MKTAFKISAIAVLATAAIAVAVPSNAAPQRGDNDHRNTRTEQRYDTHDRNTQRNGARDQRRDTKPQGIVRNNDRNRTPVVVNNVKVDNSKRYVAYRGTRLDRDRYATDRSRQQRLTKAYYNGYREGRQDGRHVVRYDYARPYWDFGYYRTNRAHYNVWRPYFGRLWLGVAQQIAWNTGYGNDCNPVTKIDYVHGRTVLTGAIMCYGRYGQAYIVPGSEEILHWY